MGVQARIVGYAFDVEAARRAVEVAFARIEAIESAASDWRRTSDVTELANASGTGEWTRISPELLTLLSRSKAIADRSQGAFDPTVGPLVDLWRRSRESEELPSPEVLSHARALVDARKLELADDPPRARLPVRGMRIDLGGIAKGYAAAAALEVLRGHGIAAALVDIGGDLAIGKAPPGRPGWEVAIPGDEPLLAVECGIATSGDLEQHVVIDGRRYSHIVDPTTGLGLTDMSQVTIVTASPADADAFASVASVLAARGRQSVERFFRAHPGTWVRVERRAAPREQYTVGPLPAGVRRAE